MPLNLDVPFTSNREAGVVVPIPTLPLASSYVIPVRISPVPSKLTPAIVFEAASLVALAALPERSPAIFTPGKSILLVPSKLTPAMVIAVSNWVALTAFPLRSPTIGSKNVFTPLIS